jgi:hypothetical protein
LSKKTERDKINYYLFAYKPSLKERGTMMHCLLNSPTNTNSVSAKIFHLTIRQPNINLNVPLNLMKGKVDKMHTTLQISFPNKYKKEKL